MAKKVKPESHYIRSALPPGQNREIKNAIRTQSEQLLILKKVRYLDGGDDNLSIPTEGSDLSDRAGPTSPESIAADVGLSGYFDAGVDDEASERTDVPDPADLVGSTPLKPILLEEVVMLKNAGPTGALIRYKKDGFLDMANAGRIFPDLHYSNKGYIPVSFHEFKQHAKWSDLHCLIGLDKKNHDCVYTRLQIGSVIHSTLGYFQALFSCIERLFTLLKVKHLLLHTAEEAESIWKTKFGFTSITSSQLQDYAKGVKTSIFEETSIMHKQILNN